MDYKGINYLRDKLNKKRDRVNLRYNVYEQKTRCRDFNISTPPQLAYADSVLGWCSKAVDCLADRLQFREFRNDRFGLNDIYNMNNPDVLFDSAILSALIASCSFIYISPDQSGFPRLQVIDGANATGIIDPITGLLNEGYAVLERDENDTVLLDAYFTKEQTIYNYAGSGSVVLRHDSGNCLLVPIVYRPDAKRDFGHSRISRACMSLMESARRTLKRSEISAEFYSFPQRYVTGLSPDAEAMDKWKASVSAMLTFTKDEDGDKPVIGQFQQQTMTPHLDQLRAIASAFAGETGLTLDDLGFPTDNPSSAEAIKAAHENLNLTAIKAQKCFGSGFLNAGYVAACLRDGIAYKRSELYETIPVWEPAFRPDAASLSSIGDGAIKINQAIPGYFTKETLKDLTGIDPADANAAIDVEGITF